MTVAEAIEDACKNYYNYNSYKIPGIVYYTGANLFTKTSFTNPIHLTRYIINEGATILFWDDGTKTVSKRHAEDTFDKELGFLFAYFQKRWDDKNKSARKRVLNSIKEEHIKTFLLEFFAKDNSITVEQARKYLNNLKVSK